MDTIEVGDWVAFYDDGRIVYACVQYIHDEIGGRRYADTSLGSRRFDAILEVRKKGTS